MNESRRVRGGEVVLARRIRGSKVVLARLIPSALCCRGVRLYPRRDGLHIGLMLWLGRITRHCEAISCPSGCRPPRMSMVRMWRHRRAINGLRRILVHYCRLWADAGGRLTRLVHRLGLHLQRGRRRMCILRVFKRDRVLWCTVVRMHLRFWRGRIAIRSMIGRVEGLDSTRRRILLGLLLWGRQPVLRLRRMI